MQNTTAYVDVFVDDFLEISQGPSHRQRHIGNTSFQAMGNMFQTLYFD